MILDQKKMEFRHLNNIKHKDLAIVNRKFLKKEYDNLFNFDVNEDDESIPNDDPRS